MTNRTKRKEQIEALKKSIGKLKAENNILEFRIKNFEVMKTYHVSKSITDDLIISEVFIKTRIKDINPPPSMGGFLGFITGLFLSKIAKNHEHYLDFECLDLKNNQKINLSLTEIQNLNTNAVTN